MPKIPKSTRPITREKRYNKPNFSGLNLEQAKVLSTILDSRNQRISVQKKKSSVVPSRAED